jgi:HEAT repeat protein
VNALALVLLAPLSLFARADTPDDVLRDLKDPAPRVRQLAAEAAGKKKLEAAAPLLGELLTDKDPSVQHAAADALTRIGPKAVPPLVAALGNENPAVKRLAMVTLAQIGPGAKDAVEPLIAAFKGKDTDTRIHAADALGKIGPGAKAALPDLIAAAKDTSNMGAVVLRGPFSGVADAAVTAALRIDPTCGPKLAEAAPELIKAVKSKDAGAQLTAVCALHQLGEHARPALPALEEARKTATGNAETMIPDAIAAITGDSTRPHLDVIADPKAPLNNRLQAVQKLGWARPKEKSLAALDKLLTDPDARIRGAAVNALAYRDDAKGAVPSLLKLLGDIEVVKADQGFEGAGRLPYTLSRIGADAVPGLVKAVGDDKLSVLARFQAVQALALMGRRAKDAHPALEKVLTDKYAFVALGAARALVQTGGDIDKALPVLRDGLEHPQPAVIHLAIRSVEPLGAQAKGVVPDLVRLLEHREADLRIAAALALGAIGSEAKGAAKAIGGMLKSENARERYQAAEALARLGPDARDAVPALSAALKNPELKSNIGHPVFKALQKLGPAAKDVVPVLMEELKTADEYYATGLIDTLGRIGPAAKAAVPQVAAFLTNKSEYTRRDAARALAGIGTEAKEAIPALKKLLTDESPMARVWGLYALGRVTGDVKSSVAKLVELLKEDPEGPGRNMDALEVLSLFGPDARPARDLLIAAVASEKTNPGPRKYAAQALGQLSEDAAVIVPKMIGVLEQPGEGFTHFTRCCAVAEVLGALGPKANDALPHLRRLAADPDRSIAEAADAAIERITRKE